jgi:hypothetical protein
MAGKPLTIIAGPAYMETATARAPPRWRSPSRRRRQNIKFHIPMPQQFTAPQAEGLEMVVYSEYRYGGLEVVKAYSMEYMYGL